MACASLVNVDGDHAVTPWQLAHAAALNWPACGSAWQVSHAGLPCLNPGDCGADGWHLPHGTARCAPSSANRVLA
ncbi:MAG: hypothetical protein NT062_20340 [Proteobacteria bacterium]|nr:hypothetical protein [Pseudomonadota bacterium]